MPAWFMSGHSLCRKAFARVATAFALGLIINQYATAAEGPAPDPRANLPGRQVYETYCVASGYGGFRQLPGNVLLAFRPKSKTR